MPSWNWDEEADDEGMVHQSVASTDHDDAAKLKQGYDYATFSEITPDPVACWPLHEDSGTTANDLAGANDGTYSGLSLGETGLIGTTSVSSDGTDDYIEITDGAFPESAPFAITLWINLSTIPSDWSTICGNGYDGTIHSPHIIYDNATLTPSEQIAIRDFDNNATPTDTFVGTGQAETTGDWVHIGFSCDNSLNVTVYRNGSEVTTGALDHLSSNSVRDSIAAHYSFGYNRHTAANFNDVRIYDTTLSQTQVQTLTDVVRSPGNWLGSGKLL